VLVHKHGTSGMGADPSPGLTDSWGWGIGVLGHWGIGALPRCVCQSLREGVLGGSVPEVTDWLGSGTPPLPTGEVASAADNLHQADHRGRRRRDQPTGPPDPRGGGEGISDKPPLGTAPA